MTGLLLKLIRDDGAVVYLNGTEVYRSNMPGGTIAYNTLASTAIGGVDESTWYSASVNPSLLLAGMNVIAVEIHQSDVYSSDISFDFQLIATLTQTPSAPAAPTGLGATAVSSSQINLSWTDNSNNETGFKIRALTGWLDLDTDRTDGRGRDELFGYGPESANGLLLSRPRHQQHRRLGLHERRQRHDAEQQQPAGAVCRCRHRERLSGRQRHLLKRNLYRPRRGQRHLDHGRRVQLCLWFALR